jgi:hypothetical protein
MLPQESGVLATTASIPSAKGMKGIKGTTGFWSKWRRSKPPGEADQIPASPESTSPLPSATQFIEAIPVRTVVIFSDKL